MTAFNPSAWIAWAKGAGVTVELFDPYGDGRITMLAFSGAGAMTSGANFWAEIAVQSGEVGEANAKAVADLLRRRGRIVREVDGGWLRPLKTDWTAAARKRRSSAK